MILFFLKLQNPRIDYIGQSAAPAPQQAAPQPASGGFDDFDDVPF